MFAFGFFCGFMSAFALVIALYLIISYFIIQGRVGRRKYVAKTE